MSTWGAAKANRLLAALLRIGWSIKRQTGSHRTLARPGWDDCSFAFHDQEEIGPLTIPSRDDALNQAFASHDQPEEIGPRMLARIAKRTGLTPDDL